MVKAIVVAVAPEPLGPMTAAISPGLKYPDTFDKMGSFSFLLALFLTMY